MNCSRAKKLISEYVDNNLDKAQKTSLEQHMQVCPDCQQLAIDFQEIVQSAKELEEVTPSDRAWLSLKSKIPVEQQEVIVPKIQKRVWYYSFFSHPKPRYVLIFTLALVIVMGVTYVGLQNWKGSPVPGKNGLQKYTMAKLVKAERHYQLAIKAFSEALVVQEKDFEPKVAEVFQTNLEIIDKSIEACRQAINSEPRNLEARYYLLAAYQKKLDFLGEIMAISRKPSQKGKLKKTL